MWGHFHSTLTIQGAPTVEDILCVIGICGGPLRPGAPTVEPLRRPGAPTFGDMWCHYEAFKMRHRGKRGEVFVGGSLGKKEGYGSCNWVVTLEFMKPDVFEFRRVKISIY